MDSNQGMALISVEHCNLCCCRNSDCFLIPLVRVGLKQGGNDDENA